MICENTEDCPHCRVAWTLTPSDRIRWEALLRTFRFSRWDTPASMLVSRAESVRTGRPMGRMVRHG